MINTPASPPSVVKWPFFVGDGLCIATMIAILTLTDRPLSGGAFAAITACLVFGVILAILPTLMEYEARLRLAEASAQTSVDTRIRKAAGLAEQLNHSVSRSQSTAEEIEKVLASNEELMEKLGEQVENMGQWMAGREDPAGSGDSGWIDSLKGIDARIRELTGMITDLSGREQITPDGLQVALADLNRKLNTTIESRVTEPADPLPAPPPPARPDRMDETARKTGESGRSDPGEDKEAIVSPRVPRDDPQPEPVAGEPRFTFSEESTSLIATAYIGIGNKLFLRGDGPGLDWEKGVPMQFLSIGKWGWSALEVDAPIPCRIYKNDDEPAIDGDILLNPSQLKEISPRF